MAAFNFTTDEVYTKPESFMYIFASEAFCNAMGTKSGNIIRGKKANQKKILLLSAQSTGKTYEDYTNAVRAGFVDSYGMTPAEALVKLAKGETVAGKNWSEGVYGVGALYNSSFSGHSEISVDESTGKILVNGSEGASQTPVVGTSKFPNGIQGYSYTDGDGNTFTSQYRSIKKKYYANSYSDKDGNRYNSNGTKLSSKDSASVWESILSVFEWLGNWILSLFGATGTSNTEKISASNTQPSQVGDGFTTTEAGFGVWGAALLAAVAAGTMLYKPGKKGKKCKK